MSRRLVGAEVLIAKALAAGGAGTICGMANLVPRSVPTDVRTVRRPRRPCRRPAPGIDRHSDDQGGPGGADPRTDLAARSRPPLAAADAAEAARVAGDLDRLGSAGAAGGREPRQPVLAFHSSGGRGPARHAIRRSSQGSDWLSHGADPRDSRGRSGRSGKSRRQIRPCSMPVAGTGAERAASPWHPRRCHRTAAAAPRPPCDAAGREFGRASLAIPP